MSMLYVDASVLILKLIWPPMLTLMSVAKPWISWSPAPETSHCEGGEPDLLFSQTIGLAGAAQGSVAAAPLGVITTAAPAIRTADAASLSRRNHQPSTLTPPIAYP